MSQIGINPHALRGLGEAPFRIGEVIAHKRGRSRVDYR